MDRIKLACLCLTASAFVLAGLLVARMPDLVPKAQAAMVDDKARFIMMTAQSKTGNESLFVLDNLNEALLVYSIDQGMGGPTGFKLGLKKAVNLATVFATQAPTGPTGPGGTTHRLAP